MTGSPESFDSVELERVHDLERANDQNGEGLLTRKERLERRREEWRLELNDKIQQLLFPEEADPNALIRIEKAKTKAGGPVTRVRVLYPDYEIGPKGELLGGGDGSELHVIGVAHVREEEGDAIIAEFHYPKHELRTIFYYDQEADKLKCYQELRGGLPQAIESSDALFRKFSGLVTDAGKAKWNYAQRLQRQATLTESEFRE